MTQEEMMEAAKTIKTGEEFTTLLITYVASQAGETLPDDSKFTLEQVKELMTISFDAGHRFGRVEGGADVNHMLRDLLRTL